MPRNFDEGANRTTDREIPVQGSADHNRDARARKGREVREFGFLMGCGTSSLGAQCASSEYDIEIARTARGLYSDRQVDRLLGMAYSLNTRVARVEGRRLGQAA